MRQRYLDTQIQKRCPEHCRTRHCRLPQFRPPHCRTCTGMCTRRSQSGGPRIVDSQTVDSPTVDSQVCGRSHAWEFIVWVHSLGVNSSRATDLGSGRPHSWESTVWKSAPGSAPLEDPPQRKPVVVLSILAKKT